MAESKDPVAAQVFDASPYLKLFIDKDGRWFQNGQEIIHPQIYRLFNSMLRKAPDGGYEVRMGSEVCRVEVEDAPFVVKGLVEGAGRISIRLNDGTEEAFDPSIFWIGAENVPYCRVKNGVFHARFSRPAYYQIARYIVSDGDDEDFFISLDGVKTLVKKAGT